jgi:hypothetical protein
MVKYKIVLTKTTTTLFYCSIWTTCSSWYPIIVVCSTTNIPWSMDYSPSITNNPSFWSWICWCTYCCTFVVAFVWPLSPSSRDVVDVVLIVPNYVDWNTIVVVAYLINFVSTCTCCYDCFYIFVTPTLVWSTRRASFYSPRISFMIFPPFISSTIIDYTPGASPLVPTWNWSRFDVTKLSSRIAKGDTQSLGKLLDMPSTSFCN